MFTVLIEPASGIRVSCCGQRIT